MSDHDQRVRAIEDALVSANAELADRFTALDDGTARASPAGAWNPSQIVWHVAKTTSFLAGALSGAVPEMVIPRTAGFIEQLKSLPMADKVKTFPMLEPPVEVSCEECLRQLRESESAMLDAVRAITPDRAGSDCVQMPFGVAFSLYELGEFTVAHVRRHLGQMERTVTPS